MHLIVFKYEHKMSPGNGEMMTLAQLEAMYEKQFPGFDPTVWSALAYKHAGFDTEKTNFLLEQRHGAVNKAVRDELEARYAKASTEKPWEYKGDSKATVEEIE